MDLFFILFMSVEDVFKNIFFLFYEEIMGYQILMLVKIDVFKEELLFLVYIDIMLRCFFLGNMKGKVLFEYDKFRQVLIFFDCLCK